MRELIVSEAPLPRIAAITKEVVEELGGVPSEHTHTATRFDHLRINEDAWSRSGYIGTYQPFGQKQVRMRIRVWASWPRRLFLGFVFLGLAEAVLFFLMSLVMVPPAPNVWIVTAILTFLAIGISLLTYSTSWAASQEIEETLLRNIGSEARADEEVPGDVYTVGGWEEHRADLKEAAVAKAKAQGDASAAVAGTETVAKLRARTPEPQPQDQRPGVLTKLKRRAGAPFQGDAEEDEEEGEADEEPAQAEAADDEEEKRSFKDKIPFLGSKGEKEEPEGEPEEEPADADAADDPRENRSLKDRIPFLGSKGEEEEGEDGAEDGEVARTDGASASTDDEADEPPDEPPDEAPDEPPDEAPDDERDTSRRDG